MISRKTVAWFHRMLYYQWKDKGEQMKKEAGEKVFWEWLLKDVAE